MPRGKNLTGSLAAFKPGQRIETCTILSTAVNDPRNDAPRRLDPA